jgi:hypothetical protein
MRIVWERPSIRKRLPNARVLTPEAAPLSDIRTRRLCGRSGDEIDFFDAIAVKAVYRGAVRCRTVLKEEYGVRKRDALDVRLLCEDSTKLVKPFRRFGSFGRGESRRIRRPDGRDQKGEEQG